LRVNTTNKRGGVSFHAGGEGGGGLCGEIVGVGVLSYYSGKEGEISTDGVAGGKKSN